MFVSCLYMVIRSLHSFNICPSGKLHSIDKYHVPVNGHGHTLTLFRSLSLCFCLFTLCPIVGRSIVYSMFVCLTVCSHTFKTTHLNFTTFSEHVARDHGLAKMQYVMYFWLCTFGFLDDVMFSYNGAYTELDIDKAPITPCLSNIDSPIAGIKRFNWVVQHVALLEGRAEVYHLWLPCFPLHLQCTVQLPDDPQTACAARSTSRQKHSRLSVSIN